MSLINFTIIIDFCDLLENFVRKTPIFVYILVKVLKSES